MKNIFREIINTLILACLIMPVIILLYSCSKDNTPDNLSNENQDKVDTAKVFYREDPTVEGPDLSHNLEIFDTIRADRLVVEAIRDRDFKKGMILWSPIEGSLVEDTVLTFGYQDLSPFWTVAQWASKISLKKSVFEINEKGDRVYKNAAKTLATNPDGSFQLEVKGKTEFGDHVKQPGESWPHLYLTQPIYPAVKIPIAKCDNIYYSLDGIREYCYNYMNLNVDLRKHTAHVVINLIIQDRNRNSSLHGKYYTLQLPCYDYRYEFPKGINRYDIGGKEVYTGALMYGPSGDELWDGTFKDGKWHKVRKDILPIILNGWSIATQKGALLEGADINNFYLTSATVGWEVSGIFDASMLFKNYSIKAVIRP